VVTHADANMTDIIKNNMDLFFLEDTIAIDLTNLDQDTALLSTGSVSTFKTKGTESRSGIKATPKDLANTEGNKPKRLIQLKTNVGIGI